MMGFKEWVLDVSMPGTCWVPYQDGDFIVGMNLIADEPPGKVVGIIHADGQDAVEAWIAANPEKAEQVRALAKRDQSEP